MSSTAAPGPLTLRSFWHDLPREGKLLLSVVVFEFIGTGLVLPFNVVYLHEVRGFALSDVGPAARAAAAGRLPGRRPGRRGDRPARRPADPDRRRWCSRSSSNVAARLRRHPARWPPSALLLAGVAFGVSWPGFQALSRP